ncbi:MAG TPA: hypothetical protein VGK67_30690 [Myxococcales bacterium]
MAPKEIEMSRARHTHGEVRPPAVAVEALKAWLEERGEYKSALAEPLGTNVMQVQRILAGTGYLSKQQRAAVERLTAGIVTEGMLAGTQKVPRSPRPPREVQRGQAAEVSPLPVPGTAARGSAPKLGVPDVLAKLAAGLLPRVIQDAMVDGGLVPDPKTGRCSPVQSPVLRHRIREWLAQELLGKPRAREVVERDQRLARDEDLIDRLRALEVGARRRRDAEIARVAAEAERQTRAAVAPTALPPSTAKIGAARPLRGRR